MPGIGCARACCLPDVFSPPRVRSEIGKVRQAMDSVNHPALLMVDGVSSIGACDFRMDEWKARRFGGAGGLFALAFGAVPR